MTSNRTMGTAILCGSLLLATGFILGLIYVPLTALELIALIAVLVTFGLLAWIGYTMATEPKPPETIPDTMPDVQPEDINMKFNPLNLRFSKVIDCQVGENTIIRDHVNLFKCKIGNNCKIESYVYIEEGVTVGDNCKIKPHVYLPTGVSIEDEVFIGPNVTFTNDKHPHVSGEWEIQKTSIGRGTSIGAGSVILPGIRIGRNVTVGAGSVVTKDIPDGTIVFGNPAREMNNE